MKLIEQIVPYILKARKQSNFIDVTKIEHYYFERIIHVDRINILQVTRKN